jgi:hypothetical protein
VQNGKPVAGVEVALTPRQSWEGGMDLAISGSVFDETRIGTRDDGSFVIPNVPAPGQWIVYAKMESVASRGATKPVVIATSHDQQEVNAGDIAIQPAYRLRGRIILSDGQKIASGMRVYLGSDVTRDTQSMLLPADGSFEFKGLAQGSYSVWAAVAGYVRTKESPEQAIVDRDIDHFDLTLHR